MITQRSQLAAKIESVEGTAETLAGVDALLVINPKFKPTTAMNARQNITLSLSPFAEIPGARSATLEFDVELKTGGALGTPPEYGKLLKACGFAETTVVSTSVTYLPASTSISSLTLALFIDGIKKQIIGARGDVSLSIKTGGIGLLHFVFTGADFTVTDAALLSTGLAYQTSKPFPFLNATFTVDSYAALLSSLDIKMNNKVQLRDSINKPSGYTSAWITDRTPSMTIDPELVTVASYDFYGKLRSGNEGALSTVIGTGAGNIITITAPKVQYTGTTPADRNGIATLGIDCQLNRNAGDDELSIVYT
jgi:hypothetical protein